MNLPKTGSGWGVAAGMVMNDDAKEDFLGIAFYTLEGTFKDIEGANIATKMVMDGVE